jgi:hypothetical protein
MMLPLGATSLSDPAGSRARRRLAAVAIVGRA